MIASGRAPGVEETRARILGAAREVCERNGTRGTTTREVAVRAGVNEATLFRHFGSKAALLTEMREQVSDLEVLRENLAALEGRDVAEDLRRIALLAVESMHRKRRMLCILLAEEAMNANDPDAPEWRDPARIHELLTTYFARLVAERRLAGEPDLLARTFLGMMFQYVIARRLWRSHAIDAGVIDTLVDVFLHGVTR